MQARFRHRRRRVWIGSFLAAALLAAAAALVAAFRHRSNRSSQLMTQASHSDYVDGAVCASCHQDIAETYRKTGMGRSFFIPTAANAVEDYAHANTVIRLRMSQASDSIEREPAHLQS